MEPIHDAIRRHMDKVGLGKAFSATLILEMANRVLPQGARAVVYKDKTVTIEANSSGQAYFLKQDTETYREQMNAALGKELIEKVRIRIKH